MHIMEIWKKIGLSLIIILAAGLMYLYLTSSEGTAPGDTPQEDSPIFPFDDAEQDSSFFDDSVDNNDEVSDADSTPSATPPQLWKISDDPVAGSGWMQQNGESEVWYVKRENGHIYRQTPENREEERITNTTIPRVQKAIISPTGEHVVYRYFGEGDNLRTYVAKLQPTNSDDGMYQINGSFLPDNVSGITFSPDGKELFYLNSNENIAVGIIRTLEGNATRRVFESSIHEWRAGWNTNSAITLFTKPTRDSEGFAYLLNPTNGSLQKIAEGLGLTASVSPNGQYVLSSHYHDNRNYTARVTTVEDQQRELLTADTLSDKCSWTSDTTVFFCGVPQEFPTNVLKSWYQGKYAYSDRLQLFNADSTNSDQLFSQEQAAEGPFDITNIAVDENFRFLQFTDRRTGDLWGFVL